MLKKASMANAEEGDLNIDSLLRKLEDAEAKDAEVSDIPIGTTSPVFLSL